MCVYVRSKVVRGGGNEEATRPNNTLPTARGDIKRKQTNNKKKKKRQRRQTQKKTRGERMGRMSPR